MEWPAPQPLKEETRAQLAKLNTATLTSQLGKRGLRSVFIGGMRALNPNASRFVGPAFTVRFIPMREDITRPELLADPEYPQRKAIETVPPGEVLVLEGRGERRGAMAGDILVTRLMVRGAAALVVDGAMRDSDEIARISFPVFCREAAAPASYTVHHAVALQVPIACAAVAVLPGDVMIGDPDGVVVIPSVLADEVAAAAAEQEDFERFVQEQVAAGRSIFGLYPPGEAAQREYQAWKAGRRPKT